METKASRKQWFCNGERASFLGWTGTLGVIFLCGALLHHIIYNEWSRNGIPSWMVAYEKWEKRQVYEWSHGRSRWSSRKLVEAIKAYDPARLLGTRKGSDYAASTSRVHPH